MRYFIALFLLLLLSGCDSPIEYQSVPVDTQAVGNIRVIGDTATMKVRGMNLLASFSGRYAETANGFTLSSVARVFPRFSVPLDRDLVFVKAGENKFDCLVCPDARLEDGRDIGYPIPPYWTVNNSDL